MTQRSPQLHSQLPRPSTWQTAGRRKDALSRLRTRIRAWLHAEAGVTAVFTALSLSVLLGFVGLAIDGSNAYYQQQRMQIAADAAVLAGSRVLALGQSPADAQSAAQTLAQLNGAQDVTVTIEAGDREIQVVTGRTFETFFARIVGQNEMTVRATARAGIVVVGQMGNLMPMTIQCTQGATTCFEYDKTYNLWDSNANQPGNLGWVRWASTDSPSEQILLNNIKYPSNSGVRAIQTLIWGTTGATVSGDVERALQEWSGKTVTIPLYSTVTGNGSNARYTISGFAQFVISEVNFKDKIVRGKFVRNVAPGEAVDGAPDYGTRDVRMLQ